MRKLTNVLFDLDGTLTDPAEGIVRCIQHSLTTLNICCPPPEELTRYIGPPLREVFGLVCNSSDDLLVERAVAVFRERFSTIGLFENTPYTDVSQMLIELRSKAYQLFVATSKPQVFAEKILRHFSLADHFIEIHGNDLEGRLDDKAELLRELLERRELRAEETIMVGDRKHDVIAAKRNGVMSLGVTYGYGTKDELVEAGVDYLCHSPLEVVSQIMKF
ncbi:MAG TPA: HAD hydrolase-like protein [Pyrinomonadaceae bacterium]|nr:HAD hydrolase-like protein [Pyrinomonadaceae bacterium]